MTVRVGVIGTGIMGADHVNTLHGQVTGAVVTLVADLDLERAQKLAADLPGVRATGDGVALIGDPAVDAVVVASADPTHADLTVAAIAAGKPVLCVELKSALEAGRAARRCWALREPRGRLGARVHQRVQRHRVGHP